MLENFGFTIEFDPKDLTIGRKFLRKLESFPPTIWNHVEDEIKKFARNRATHITRFSVSKSTQEWRKRANKKGKRVETHRGAWKVPLVGSRVGKRTSTFVDDFRESKEPGVTIGTGNFAGYSGIKNGTFAYNINADAFAEVPGWGGYPNIFFNYLQQRGIIPEEGYLAMEGGEEELILDYLEREVLAEIDKKWGSNQ